MHAHFGRYLSLPTGPPSAMLFKEASILLPHRQWLKASAIEHAIRSKLPDHTGGEFRVREGKPGHCHIQFADTQAILVSHDHRVPDADTQIHQAHHSPAALLFGWQPGWSKHRILLRADRAELDDDLSKQLRLTRVIAVLSELLPDAVGIAWHDGDVCHSPRFFQELSQLDFGHGALWVGTSVAKQEERFSFLSVGLRERGWPLPPVDSQHIPELHDLLMTAPAQDFEQSLEFFTAIVDYLYQRGYSIPEGETMGPGPAQRWPIRYGPSPVEEVEQVMMVDASGFDGI